MHRRELLHVFAASAGLQCLDGLAIDAMLRLGRRVHDRGRAAASGFRVLGPHAAATVTAAAERIIPASDTPGATDAGVTVFIDHMLADWYEPALRDRLLAGLAELDARSHARGGRAFVGLPEAEQAALLATIDDEVGAAGEGADHWFAMLKFLTVWGYFTSEVAVRETLRALPLPGRYDGCAPAPTGGP